MKFRNVLHNFLPFSVTQIIIHFLTMISANHVKVEESWKYPLLFFYCRISFILTTFRASDWLNWIQSFWLVELNLELLIGWTEFRASDWLNWIQSFWLVELNSKLLIGWTEFRASDWLNWIQRFWLVELNSELLIGWTEFVPELQIPSEWGNHHLSIIFLLFFNNFFSFKLF